MVNKSIHDMEFFQEIGPTGHARTLKKPEYRESVEIRSVGQLLMEFWLMELFGDLLKRYFWRKMWILENH